MKVREGSALPGLVGVTLEPGERCVVHVGDHSFWIASQDLEFPQNAWPRVALLCAEGYHGAAHEGSTPHIMLVDVVPDEEAKENGEGK